MGGRYVVFLLRLAVAVVSVGVLMHVARPLLCTVTARAGRDIVLLTSWLPHLAELSWTGDRFVTGTILAGQRFAIGAGLFLFTVGFPVAFAAALPGIGTVTWWQRLLGVGLLSVAVSAVILALIADAKTVQEVSRLGVRVNPRWRDLLVHAAMMRSWDIGALLYPFGVCVSLVWVGLLRPLPVCPSRLEEKRRLRVTLVVAVLVLAGLGVADWVAERRLQVPRGDLYARVVALNPGRGPFVLRLALRHEKSGEQRKALYAYALAAYYPLQSRQAQRGIQRIQALHPTR